jgi:hypothetical protein
LPKVRDMTPILVFNPASFTLDDVVLIEDRLADDVAEGARCVENRAQSDDGMLACFVWLWRSLNGDFNCADAEDFNAVRRAGKESAVCDECLEGVVEGEPATVYCDARRRRKSARGTG